MLKKIFKDKKNIVIISVLGAFLILGATYALINWTTNNYNVAIRSTCMNINYSNGQDIDTNINAINESQFINGNTLTVSPDMVFSTVSIELDDVCSDVEGFATLEINVSSLSDQLKLDGKYAGSLRYILVEYDPSDYENLSISELVASNFTILDKGSIVDDGLINLYYQYLVHGEVHNYLIFFYADNILFGNSMLDLSFEGSISAKVEQFIPTPISSFNYSISNGQITLTRYNSNDPIVRIAPTYVVNGVEYNTIIGSGLFTTNKIVKDVYFADGVLASSSSIGMMFSSCTNLLKVTNLPKNITSLSRTFESCTRLVNAPAIPNSVTVMNNTFYGCTNLINAPAIPNSVTTLRSAFSECKNLVITPVMPTSLIDMHNTFSECTNLVNAPVIPDSVTDMGYTFSGCSSLVSIPNISNSVVDMSYTFNNCASLISVPMIPSSVTNMTQTFNSCANLTGTVRINSSNVNRTSGSSNHPFYKTSKPITVEVPSGSTTYTNIYINKPSNVTIVQY